MALTYRAKKTLWLQGILSNLGARKHWADVQNIYIDNEGAIALSKNPEFHNCTNHTHIQYYIILENVEGATIELTYSSTGDMTANIFTKAPPQPTLTKHNLGLRLIDQSIIVLECTPDNWPNIYQDDQVMSPSKGRY